MIRSWISVWTAVLTVREHLTECLKNAIKPHQVNIGKTKDEIGKGIEVGNEKVMQEKAADILQLEEEGENLFNF